MDSHTFSKTQPPTVTYSFPIILNSLKLYSHLLNYSQLLKLLPVTKNKQQLLKTNFSRSNLVTFTYNVLVTFSQFHTHYCLQLFTLNGSVIATTLSNSE